MYASNKKILVDGITWNLPFLPESEVLVNSLTDLDAADFLLMATFKGSVNFAGHTWVLRGPLPVVYQNPNPETNPPRLNGFKIDHSFFNGERLTNIQSASDMRALIKNIDGMSMQGVINPGSTFPLLFAGFEFDSALSLLRSSKFDGVLPTLTDGVVDSPELAASLYKASMEMPVDVGYKKIICWASEDMASSFSERMKPLRPFQCVLGGDNPIPIDQLSNYDQDIRFTELLLGLTFNGSDSGIDGMLVHYMADTLARMGFKHPSGYVLCETDVEFLLDFPSIPGTQINSKAATDFVKSYFPLDIMAEIVTDKCELEFGLTRPNKNISQPMSFELNGSNTQLFDLMAPDSIYRDQIIKLMPFRYWQELLKKSSGTGISGLHLSYLWDAIGLDNTYLQVNLQPESVEILKSVGYVFSDKTKVFKSGIEFNNSSSTDYESTSILLTNPYSTVMDKQGRITFEYTASQSEPYFIGLMDMGVWPSPNIEKPSSIAVGLRLAARKRFRMQNFKDYDSMVLRSFLRRSGLQACVDSAKTSAQWIVLTEIFAADDLKPYLNIMDDQAKGRVLEQGLGL